MKRVQILVSEELDKHFRNAVFKKCGLVKGAYTHMLIEAMELWLKEN